MQLDGNKLEYCTMCGCVFVKGFNEEVVNTKYIPEQLTNEVTVEYKCPACGEAYATETTLEE